MIKVEMWDFICENYSGYSSCDCVLHSDIHTKFLDGELDPEDEDNKSDIDWILEDKPAGIPDEIWVQYNLMKIDADLLKSAIEEKTGIFDLDNRKEGE